MKSTESLGGQSSAVALEKFVNHSVAYHRSFRAFVDHSNRSGGRRNLSKTIVG